MEASYSEAIKAYTRVGDDAKAASIEKTLASFQESAYTVVYLHDLDPAKVAVQYKEHFDKRKDVQIDEVEFPKSIGLHPPGNADPASVSFQLDGSWVRFKSSVGIMSPNGNHKLGSPLVFDVVCDGKVVWSSKPVKDFEQLQSVDIPIQKVQSLSIHVRHTGSDHYAHAVWLSPRLIR